MVIVRVLGPLDWTEGHEQWRRVLEEEAAAGRPADLPKKIFIPKQDLPQLRSYKGPAGKEFWDQFPKNHTWPGKSLINADRLELYGLQLGLIDLRFEQVLGRLPVLLQPSSETHPPSLINDGRSGLLNLGDMSARVGLLGVYG